MSKIYFKDLKDYIDKEITIEGFVESVRNLQWVQFVVLRDSTGRVQVTIEKSLEENEHLVEVVNSLSAESTVRFSGVLKSNEKVKLNQMEFTPSSIEVTSECLEEIPLNLKDKNATLRDTRLDYRYIDLRRDENALLFKVATCMESAMREYFINNDYIEIHTPKISASNAESGAEMFKLDYFGKKANLIQSPQFYKQMAISSGFDKVFEVGPVFRAENSNTSVHTTEFRGFDVEIGWVSGVDEVMDVEEAWCKYFIDKIKEKYADKIKEVFNVELSDTSVKFPRINFNDVKRIVKEEYGYVSEKKDDLDNTDESKIGEYVKKKYGSDFVFVTNYPYSARSFYVMKDEEGVTQTYDLLFKGVEITSGAQREHRYGILKKQIEEKGLNPSDLQFYLDFFKYGCPQHGGFGVGLERVIMCILNIDNIREVAFIFRGPNRLNP